MNKVIERKIKTEVIKKIMNLFWRRGYFNTSVEEIVDESGMSRAVIYKYFGDKERLFEYALYFYLNNVVSSIQKPLHKENAGFEELHKFFEQFNPASEELTIDRSGCLMVATLADYPLHSERIRKVIRKFRNELYTKMKQVLIREKAENNLKKDINVEGLAALLLSNLLGTISLVRGEFENEMVENIIYTTHRFIEEHKIK